MENNARLQSALLIAHTDSMREDGSNEDFSRSWKSSVSQEREFRGRKRDVYIKMQGALQAYIRPAEWFVGARALRRIREEWVVNKSPEDFCDKLFNVLDATTDVEASRLRIGHISNQMPTREYHKNHCSTMCGQQNRCDLHAEFHLLTPYGWLDILDVCISSNSEKDGLVGADGASCTVSVTLAATGLCPLPVCCAPLFNAALFFVPFSSSVQKPRLDYIADKLAVVGCSLQSRRMLPSW